MELENKDGGKFKSKQGKVLGGFEDVFQLGCDCHILCCILAFPAALFCL